MARVIVVGTDGSNLAEEAVRQATEIAQRDKAVLHLVTAYPDPQVVRERTTVWTNDPKGIVDTGRPEPGHLETVNLRGLADNLAERAAQYAIAQGVTAETHIVQGHPADVILDIAKKEHADLIVIGSRGLTGIRRYLLGSVSSKVSEHAKASVMIVRAD